MLSVQTGAATSVGRVRKVNEDAMVVATPLFAVADGMGGHAAGDVASQLAIQRLHDLLPGPGLHPEDVLAALQTVNSDILAATSAQPDHVGMGTTVTGLSIVLVAGSDHWLVFNVGDSRVYRFASGRLVQLTVDHSEVEEMLSAGAITQDQALSHPHRNVVTRSLGTVPPPTPDLWVFPPSPSERFLLCSDGLPRELTDEQIGDVLRANSDPQKAADELVKGAVEAGGSDNVTVVVVDLLAAADGDQDRPNMDTAPRLASHRGA